MLNLMHFCTRMGRYWTEVPAVRISGVKDVEVLQWGVLGSIEVCAVKSVLGLGKAK